MMEICVYFKLVRSPANHSMSTRRSLHRRPRIHAYDALKEKNNKAHSLDTRWEKNIVTFAPITIL